MGSAWRTRPTRMGVDAWVAGPVRGKRTSLAVVALVVRSAQHARPGTTSMPQGQAVGVGVGVVGMPPVCARQHPHTIANGLRYIQYGRFGPGSDFPQFLFYLGL